MFARRWGNSDSVCLAFLVAVWSSFLVPVAADTLTVQVPKGFSTIANPFEGDSYAVSNLLPNVPVGTMLYKFDTSAQKWSVNQWQRGAWNLPEQTLGPGEGAMIRNPSNPFFVTFNGTLLTNFVPALKPGFNLVSLPQGGAGNLNAEDYDWVGVWDPVAKGLRAFIYHPESGWTSDTAGHSNPPIRPGESFIYFPNVQAHPPPPEPLPSFYFNNYVPAADIYAPLFHFYLECVGSDYLIQLFSAPGGATDPGLLNMPEGEPVPIAASTNNLGFIDAHRDLVQFSTNVMGPMGSRAFELRAWDSRAGPTYDDIFGSGYDLGRSGWFYLYSPEPWWGNWGPFGAYVPPRNLDTLPSVSFGKSNPFPLGVHWPADTTVFVGQAFAWENAPLFTYPNQIPQWQKQVGSNVWSNVGRQGDWSLTLASVQKSDAGNYRLYVSEDCGGFSTLPVELKVLDRPRFESIVVRETDGAVMLQVRLEPNQAYQLEGSSNLVNWVSLASILDAPVSWEWIAATSPDSPRQFYRIRAFK